MPDSLAGVLGSLGDVDLAITGLLAELGDLDRLIEGLLAELGGAGCQPAAPHPARAAELPDSYRKDTDHIPEGILIL
ncbi:MAG TPA: hypothetical protein PLS95_14785 [Thermoanaerobaculales bacterium]|nr:hypothetical protein [Thermoanaerobaculales bacterium]HQN95695.1 hypothetical protein [Thermoanaerobaculales bacterium]HQP43719.1 hypothetical protein [Thermoanaerobaculales bacterium]